MKKVLFLLIVLAAVAFFTCPDKEAHAEAIVEEVDVMLKEELAEDSGSFLEKGLAKIGSAIGSSVVKLVMDTMLSVENYGVCSVGKITVDDETRFVSFGMFNYVYTNVPEELKKQLNGK